MSEQSPDLVARVAAMETQVNKLINNLALNNNDVVAILDEWLDLMNEHGERVRVLSERLKFALGERTPPGCKTGT